MVFGKGKQKEMKEFNRTQAKKSHKSGRMKKGQASKMGKNSRKFENAVANKLPYKDMFLPQSVCDRIAVVNREPVFIEIKHKGEKLREKQLYFKNLIGSAYIVVEE